MIEMCLKCQCFSNLEPQGVNTHVAITCLAINNLSNVQVCLHAIATPPSLKKHSCTHELYTHLCTHVLYTHLWRRRCNFRLKPVLVGRATAISGRTSRWKQMREQTAEKFITDSLSSPQCERKKNKKKEEKKQKTNQSNWPTIKHNHPMEQMSE